VISSPWTELGIGDFFVGEELQGIAVMPLASARIVAVGRNFILG